MTVRGMVTKGEKEVQLMMMMDGRLVGEEVGIRTHRG